MSMSETAMKHANPDYASIYDQIGQYWGEQPGTSGPVYVGAFVMLLFILGLFIVKGPVKWALLAATILSILLSWGRNFMGFTDFFLDYVPMYAKFRTVASILVGTEASAQWRNEKRTTKGAADCQLRLDGRYRPLVLTDALVLLRQFHLLQ